MKVMLEVNVKVKSSNVEYESKNLSLKEYLDKVEPYLTNIIIDLVNSDT